jgi:PHD/YefM family antitoxin component YafN of YafNO toxin-antitoxin module
MVHVMTINDVTPVSEARKDLSSLMRQAEPTVIGSHGKAEAVLMPIDYMRAHVLPPELIETLLTSVATAQAEYALRVAHPVGETLVHPGDSLGKVVAWLWTSGQKSRLGLFMGDYMAALRNHNPRRDTSNLITFETVLKGLPLALPYSFPDAEQPALLDYLREVVPGFYGGDLNSTTV